MKRISRSESDSVIGGVCGGLGRYLNVDPLIVRILFVVGAMANGIGVIAYILLWIFVPTEGAGYDDQEEMIHQNVEYAQHIPSDNRFAIVHIAEMRERARTLGHDAQQALGKSTPQESSGTLVGGLILITLGILILMRNFGLLRWIGNLLWPLVLIAIGAVMLLNNIKGKR